MSFYLLYCDKDVKAFVPGKPIQLGLIFAAKARNLLKRLPGYGLQIQII
jgi:hypothetical protein